MATTYVISPPTTAGRMEVRSYPTREAAAAHSSRNDRLISDPVDVLWTGHTLVDVYNSLTGSKVKKFESREVGVRRLLQALESVAVEAGSTPEDDMNSNVYQQELDHQGYHTTVDDESIQEEEQEESGSAEEAKRQEREAAKEAKRQERKAAKEAKRQEREAAKEAKRQEREAAKEAKRQEREAAKEAKRQEREAAKEASSSLGRNKFTTSAVIKLLVNQNPKKYGAAAQRFELYRDGMTVEEALLRGVLRADLSWDTRHGFIRVEE
jgi:acetyl/propionyl-CoA carboxylase alpha subunit